MAVQFTIPPGTRAVGTVDPAGDMNNVTAALNVLGAVISVLNTAYSGGADPTGTNDSTTAIQAALTASAGGICFFPEGTFKVSSALTVPGSTIIQGSGMNGTTIQTTSTTADVLTMTDQRYVAVRDLRILGPGSGTGRGIAFLHSASALASISIRNVFIKSMGGSGVQCDTLITSDLTNVRVETCGADNIFIQNSTSTVLNNCYANGPTTSSTATGYRLNNCRYMELNACAADGVTDVNGAYFIQGGTAIAFNGCGCENPPTGFKITSSAAGICLNGCRVLGVTGVAYLVTSTSVNCTLNTCTEISPGGGATASIKVDTGS